MLFYELGIVKNNLKWNFRVEKRKIARLKLIIKLKKRGRIVKHRF
jgi:hypothetical protein